MFKRMINRNKYYDQETRAHLNSLSEKEYLYYQTLKGYFYDS